MEQTDMYRLFLVARREYLAYVTAWGFWIGLLITPLALGLGTTAAATMYGQASAAEPKQGGHFRVGLKHGSTSDSLNPELNNGTHTLLDFSWRGYLVEMDVNGRPV
ncbi:MAG: hypothetical protein CMK07_03040, partial [Ponticaulis sp.]|nr:hypothetical protein [Ponticaulis sp.]